jgi:hypothetical protein
LKGVIEKKVNLAKRLKKIGIKIEIKITISFLLKGKIENKKHFTKRKKNKKNKNQIAK